MKIALAVLFLVACGLGAPVYADVAPPPDTSCEGKSVGDQCYNKIDKHYGKCEQGGSGLNCVRVDPQPDGGPPPDDDKDDGGCTVASRVPPVSGLGFVIGLLLLLRLRRRP